MPNFFSNRWSCRTRSRRLSFGSGCSRSLTALLSSSSESFLVWRGGILAIVVLFLIPCHSRSKNGNCNRLWRNEKKEDQTSTNAKHPCQVKRKPPVTRAGPHHNHNGGGK